jgi:hypothetical protein
MIVSPLVRRAFTGLLAVGALSLPVHRAAAQKAHATSADHDLQTLASYRLTEAGLRKYYKAIENVGKAAMKDSTLGDAVDSGSSSDNADIAAMAANYDRVPALKSALAAVGLTGTDFATFSLSYMQAVMTYGLMTQGPEKLRIKEVPKGTPKENVDFVRTHQALIQQLDAEIKSLQPPS